MKKNKLPKCNNEIDATSIRLIDSSGKMIGVVKTEEALRQAASQGLDLVEISPNVNPPVCKILDFGKYKYEIQKRANEAKKKQKTIDIKEIKIRPNIGDHDYNIKLKAILKFLSQGDKVKISIRFRGREIMKQEIAMSIMKNIGEATAEVAKIEVAPKMESRQLLMFLSPN